MRLVPKEVYEHHYRVRSSHKDLGTVLGWVGEVAMIVFIFFAMFILYVAGAV